MTLYAREKGKHNKSIKGSFITSSGRLKVFDVARHRFIQVQVKANTLKEISNIFSFSLAITEKPSA